MGRGGKEKNLRGQGGVGFGGRGGVMRGGMGWGWVGRGGVGARPAKPGVDKNCVPAPAPHANHSHSHANQPYQPLLRQKQSQEPMPPVHHP